VTQELQEFYKGARFTVMHCAGARDSFNKALQRIEKAKRLSLTNQIVIQITRLASGAQMSNASFPKEGELPRKSGRAKKHFYALKKIPLRVYCWYSDRIPGTIFISHYTYKDRQKLADSDTSKVGLNWIRVEENGHDR
jgi:hypothetical protein